jgi:hypothetical protein
MTSYRRPVPGEVHGHEQAVRPAQAPEQPQRPAGAPERPARPAGAPEAPTRAEARRPAAPAKTSAAATFALVLGVAAIICVASAILSPVGLVLGIIGVVLGIVGLQMARRPGVTGRGVATGGLVLSILSILLAAVFAAGVSTFLNDQRAVDRLQEQVDNLRSRVPR